MTKNIVIKVHMPCDKSRSKAMAEVVAVGRVDSVVVAGQGKDHVEVVGDVDPVKLTCVLRKKVDGDAQLVRVVDTKEEKKKPDAAASRFGPQQRKDASEKNIVIKVHMPCDKSRSKAMAEVVAVGRVDSVGLAGEGKDHVEVVGDVDPVKLTCALRKKVDEDAQLVRVVDAKEEKKKPDAAASRSGPQQRKDASEKEQISISQIYSAVLQIRDNQAKAFTSLSIRMDSFDKKVTSLTERVTSIECTLACSSSLVCSDRRRHRDPSHQGPQK